jgi:3-methyladenine DNA glycosylase AlkD
MNSSKELKERFQLLADPARANDMRRFFKTGPGEYGEGDRFIGLSQPQIRAVVRECRNMPLNEALELVKSPVHEERMAGLLIMVELFKKAKKDEKEQKRIVDAYLKHLKYVNNWDLVDLSCPRIYGEWLLTRDRAPLYRMITSGDLWTRRVALLATFTFIYNGESKDALQLARMVLEDKEDLIHKASGWMLREVGKRISLADLRGFLKDHHKVMPRTMLRYAIEKLSPSERKRWMAK